MVKITHEGIEHTAHSEAENKGERSTNPIILGERKQQGS